MSKNQFTGTATQPQRNRKFVNLIMTSTVIQNTLQPSEQLKTNIRN